MNPPSNAFAMTLQDQRKGELLHECSQRLAELVSACRETGKSGTLTLKLTVNIPKQAEAGTVYVHDEVTIKTPKPRRDGSLFFTTDDNRLTRANPNQRELPLATVSTEHKEPLREVRVS